MWLKTLYEQVSSCQLYFHTIKSSEVETKNLPEFVWQKARSVFEEGRSIGYTGPPKYDSSRM